MTYTEAKIALINSGITQDSGDSFSLYYEGPFNPYVYKIDMVIIAENDFWGDVWQYMINSCCDNEEALKGLEIIDNDNLQVFLISNIKNVDQVKWTTLTRYQSQQQAP